jgi:glycosyltransferase involved in cell wall biosynthesis
MLKNKGVYELVEASKLLHKQGLSFEISIVGIIDKDNPNNIPINQLIKWDTQGWIRWLGQKNNMPEVIKNFHFVALPTFYGEGIPRFLIEAASCGRPIVTTDIPGCRELVKNGVNGLLVPPQDSISLAHALGIFIKNKSLRKEMGIRGRKIVEDKFSEKIVIEDTLNTYDELLN